MQAGQVWTTKDYYDPWPGFYAGLAQKQSGQADQRLAMQQQEQSNAERQRQEQAKIQAEARDMQQARVISELNVDPVRRPDGSIDWQSTGQAARMRKELAGQAATLGRLHAAQGGPSSLTQPEYALTQLPEYQEAYRLGTIQKAESDAKQAAVLEQIGLRAKGNLDVANERNRPMATVTEELPDGRKISQRMPADEADQLRNAAPASPTDQKWNSVIENIQRMEQAGVPIDVDYNDQGFPVISKSWMNHDASPKDKGSYQRLVTEFLKRAGMQAPKGNAGAPTGGSSPMIVIPR